MRQIASATIVGRMLAATLLVSLGLLAVAYI
jgi:hypothetical protein